MAGRPVDEKIVKVSMDISDFNKNGEKAKGVLSKMFDGMKNAFSKINGNGIKKSMNDINRTVEAGANQTKSLLGKLRDSFGKILGKGIDTKAPVKSVKQMNTELSNSVSQSGTILGRLRSVFSKTSINGDGFKQVGVNAQQMVGTVQKSQGLIASAISGIMNSFGSLGKVRFSGVEDSLGGLQGSINKVDASPIADSFASAAGAAEKSIGIMEVALGTFAGNAITKAANSVMGFGKQFTQGARDGFNEYELKMRSVQTILANSRHKGYDMADVSGYLDALNEYADRTIYSFSDMTNAIGRFTAAGVPLDTSTIAIKGMANAAAMAGSSTEDLSRAYVQVSQAMSQGYFSLMDWKSVENANMSTERLRETLIKFGKEYGTITDDMEVTTDNFRNTLTDHQWLTADVWNAAMQEFQDNTTELGKAGYEAAVKIKTFSQLVDTVKESIGSGWAQTWEAIFGNYEEAMHYWTKIGSLVEEVIGYFSGGRTAMFEEWHELGGYADLWDGIVNLLSAVVGVFRSVATAAKAVFGESNMGVNVLLALSAGFKKLTSYIVPGTKGFGVLVEIFKVLFGAIKIVTSVLSVLIKAALIPLKIILAAVAVGITAFVKVIEWIGKAVNFVLQPISDLIEFISQLVNYGLGEFEKAVHGGIKSAIEFLKKGFESILKPLETLTNSFKKFVKSIDGSEVMKVLGDIAKVLGTVLKSAAMALAVVLLGPLYGAFKFISAGADRLLGYLKKLSAGFTALSKVFTNKFMDIFNKSGMEHVLDNLKKNANEMVDAIKRADWKGALVGFDKFKDGVAHGFGLLRGIVKSTYKDIRDTQPFKFLEKHLAPVTNFANSVGKEFNKIASKAKTMWDEIAQPKVNKSLDVIDSKFKSLGITLSGFGKFGKNFFKGIDPTLLEYQIKKTTLSVKEFWKSLTHGDYGKAQVIFETLTANVSKLAKYIKDGLKYALSGIIDFDFFKGKFDKMFIADFREAKKAILDFWKWVKGVFTGDIKVGDALKALVDGIKNTFNSLKTAIGKIDIGSAFDDIKSVLKPISDMINGIRYGNLDKATVAFGNFKDTFRDGSWVTKVMAGIVSAGFAAYALVLWNNLRKWGKLIGTITDIGKALADMAESAANAPKTVNKIGGAFTALKFALAAGTALAIAAAIRQIADAIKILSEIDYAKAKQGVAIVSIIIAELTLATAILGMTGGSIKSALSMIAMAETLKRIGVAIETLGKMDQNTLKQGGIVAGVIMAALAICIRAMNEGAVVRGGNKNALNILAMTAAIYGIGLSIEKLGKLNRETMNQGVFAVSIIMGAIGMSTRMMNQGSRVKGANRNSLQIISLATSVYMVGISIEKLGKLSINHIVQGGVAATAIMGAISYCVRLMNMTKGASIKNAATLLALSVSTRLLGDSVVKLGMLPMHMLERGVVAVATIMATVGAMTSLINASSGTVSLKNSVTILALTAATYAIGVSILALGRMNQATLIQGGLAATAIMGAVGIITTMLGRYGRGGAKGAAVIVAMAASLNLLIPPLLILGTMDFDTLKQGLLAVSALLVSLSIAMEGFGKISGLSGAATMAVMTVSLMALAQVVSFLGSLPWQTVAIGLGAMAGMLALLVLAGMGLNGVAIGLGALAAVIASIGVTLLGAAAVINALVGAFQLLNGASESELKAVVDNIVIFLTELAARSFEMGVLAAEFIIKFVAGLASQLPTILQMGISIVVAFLNGLREGMPEMVTAAVELLTTFMDSITANLPQLVQSAVQLITTFITSLLNELTIQIPALTTSVGDFLVAVFQGAIDLLVAVLGPMLDIIITAFQGLSDALSPIIDSIGQVIMKIADSIARIFEQISPILQGIADIFTSVFEGIGTVLEGFSTVIDSVFTGASTVITAFGDAVKNILDGVKGVIEGIGSSAKKVGKAFDDIADAIDKLSGVGALEIASILGAVALGIDGIVKHSATIKTTADNMGLLASGLLKMNGLGSVSSIITTIASSIQNMSTAMATLAPQIARFNDGTSTLKTSLSGLGAALTSAIPGLTSFNTTLLQNTRAMTMMSGLFSSFNSSMSSTASILSSLTGTASTTNGVLTTLSTTLSQITSSATSLSASMSTLLGSITSLSSSFMSISTAATSTGAALTLLASQTRLLVASLALLNVALGNSNGVLTTFSAAMSASSTAAAAANGGLTRLNAGFTTLNATITNTVSSVNSLAAALPGVSSGFTAISSSVASAMASIATSVTTTMNQAVNTARSAINGMVAAINSGAGQIRNAFNQVASAIKSSMNQVKSTVSSSTAAIISSVRSMATQIATIGAQGGRQFGQNLTNGIRSGQSSATAAAQGIVNSVRSIVQSGYGGMVWAGNMLSQGVAQGMWNGLPSIQAAANAIINTAQRAAQAAARIHSPSRLFRDFIGLNITKGVAVGMDKGGKYVVKSAKAVIDVAKAAAEKASNGMDGLLNDVFGGGDDDPYQPTIVPIVDSRNYDEFRSRMDEIKMGTKPIEIRRESLDRKLGLEGMGATTNTYNNDSHVTVNVNVDGGIDEENIPVLARRISREIQLIDEKDRDSRGGLY